MVTLIAHYRRATTCSSKRRRSAPPRNAARAVRGGLTAGLVLGLALGHSACQSPESYRQEADTVVEDILRDKQQDALGKVDERTFEVMTPADTLRRRLLTSQGLPIVGPESLGIDALEAIDYWPEDDYLTALVGETDGLDPEILGVLTQPNLFGEVSVVGPTRSDEEVLALSLDGAMMVAASSSRDYQAQKENVFQSALSLDLERHEFRTTFSGLYRGLISGQHDSGDGTPGGSLTNSFEAGAQRRFENGASLASNLALDLAQILGSAGQASSAVSFDASVAIPLMRGSGAHIVAEPMRQAERNVVYALWSFERFKRTFAVSIASEYIAVLQQQDRVRNATQNYISLIQTTRRSSALRDAGRLSVIDYGQAVQNEISARSRWINDIQSYRRSLDDFKVELGLPPDARLLLQPAELTRLDNDVRQLIPLVNVVNEGDADQEDITLYLPTRDAAGPLELPTPDAMRLAFRYRLDLQTAMGNVYDAQRRVVVAADGFLPELSILGRVSMGGSTSSGNAEDVTLDLDTARYSALLTLDLPFDRVSERNRYRNALISLERSIRSLQSLEDNIKTDVLDQLRALELARAQVPVQGKAVEVAEQRLDQAVLSLELGRDIRIRDVTEANEDLINAQNALTNALVSYRIAEWRLQRDTGILEVGGDGLWEPFDVDRLDRLVEEATQVTSTEAADPVPAPGSSS